MVRTFSFSFPRRGRAPGLAGAIMLGLLASPAQAAPETQTRVVRCAAGNCLLVIGYREDPAASVSINGRDVQVTGRHKWRATVPVAAVRSWSAPEAREIEVALRDPDQQLVQRDLVDLPLGLLGTVSDLSAIEISLN